MTHEPLGAKVPQQVPEKVGTGVSGTSSESPPPGKPAGEPASKSDVTRIPPFMQRFPSDQNLQLPTLHRIAVS
jgi:hypothetical protein